MLISPVSQKLRPNPKYDYTESKKNSLILCNQIEKFWHNKGFSTVKAWPEKEKIRGREHWTVKSNLKLSANSSDPTIKFLY